MRKKIKIIGAGPDGQSVLTDAARTAIDGADVIIGAKRVLDMLETGGKPVFVSYDPKEIAAYIKTCGYENIAAVMSGDTGFYSGAAGLIKELRNFDTEVIPGISSLSYFFSRLKMPYQGVKVISLHGTDNCIARHVRANNLTFFLLGAQTDAARVCGRLCEYGMDGVKIFIGENLAMDNERILTGRAADLVDVKTGNLCVLLAENPDYERGMRTGIPDGEFIRGGVPMTKSEIRAVCVSKLGIGESDICWDIGCGTGSVSVEMALRCQDGKVYAVDKNAGAAELTDKNRKKFGCDNIEIVQSDAVLSVQKLPAPDCVFIGGAGGMAREIIAAAREKNPDVRIVMTAVSLETLAECRAAFADAGMECDTLQIAVTRTKRIGAHTIMDAQNPVFITEGGGR